MLNFHWVLFSLFQGLSVKTYSRVYFSLCLFLTMSGRSRTQRKLNSREKFPIYGKWHVDASDSVFPLGDPGVKSRLYPPYPHSCRKSGLKWGGFLELSDGHVSVSVLLRRLRSIAEYRDHFVRRLSVRPSVCPVVTLSW